MKIDKLKEEYIAEKFSEIMTMLGLDLENDSLQKTPQRVAKMFCRELFYGLESDNYPSIMVQENKFNYNQMLVIKDIKVNSVCEHHFVPIIGVAHVAYVPDKKILGLSKFNRIVDFFSRRPQVQERLTNDILNDLTRVLETDNVAVRIEAEHLCVKIRGVKDSTSKTITTALEGVFLKDNKARNEFLSSVR